MYRVLVYGGCGALGRTVVSTFKRANFSVISVDFSSNDEANSNIILVPGEGFEPTYNKVNAALTDAKLDAIFNVAGGWAGGNLHDAKLIHNVDLMWSQSVHSSVVTAAIAANHLKEGGVVTLTGAAAATGPTPGMIAYGMAKASVHHLVKSAAAPGSGLPANAKINAILPITLDTPMNRKFNPDADYSTWTPLSEIADKFLAWATGKESPENGSLVKIQTEDNKTYWTPV
ncbi:hypothetical protein BJ742DRAFT_821229 [Cladochytrium replicatum]|nr:hypothetical protein BJ742DRAFT_821229 [Cladochytrium replicatum]